MSTPLRAHPWDATAEEKRFRESLERAHRAQNDLGEQLSKSSPDFHLLCVAELDAGSQLVQSGCFSTREAFVAELKRLIAEPTVPSRPVPSLQAYKDSQKWWLESLLLVYEQSSLIEVGTTYCLRSR